MSDANRTIVSSIRSSETFAALDYRQRDLWHGLIAMADDQGRLRGDARYIKSIVWPYDDLTAQDVQEGLAFLATGLDPFIHIFVVKGKSYIQIINWWKYQKMSWAGPSQIPAPEGWTDRLRYHAKGKKIITINWEQIGGFEKGVRGDEGNAQDSALHSEIASELPCHDVNVNDDVNVDVDVDDDVDLDVDALAVPAKKTTAKTNNQLVNNFERISRNEILKMWREALGQLQLQADRVFFDTWVRPLKVKSFQDCTLTVEACNSYGRDMVRSRAGPQLESMISGFAKQEITIRFVCPLEESAVVAAVPN